jgi:hypothetical protein
MAKQSNNLQGALQGLSEQEAYKLLVREGKRLERIAKKAWQVYYASYKPVEYVREYDSNKAIKLGRVKKVGPNQLGIELTWEDSLAYHPSRFKGGKKGHSIILISEGWHSKKLEAKIGRRYRFTYFEGTGYISKVISLWNAGAPKGISIELQKNR